LEALLKKEERERERKKSKRKRTNIPIKKHSPIKHPKFSPKFFQSSKKRGMRIFSREQ
jgi:hypothetical protein